MSIQLHRHRFTVDEYHGMARAGVLTEDDRVGLVEGEIVDTPPIGLRDAAAVNVLNRWLTTGCGSRAIVQVRVRSGSGSSPSSSPTSSC